MRDIVSPLAGFSSPFGRGADPYAILGYKPPIVLDYENSKFRVSGSTSTAPSVVTATRTGLATQLNSAGNLVWNAHNLALNSATPATQSITVVSGADYTVECTGSGSITLSGAGTGSVTAGNPVEITASTTTLTLTVVGSLDTMWAYRSDLGGMAPVPLTRRVAGSATYVPTTSAAVYLPREEAYTYVSGSLVGPYYQKESDARTNLVTYSEDFTGSIGWSNFNSIDAKDAVGPDGEANSATTLADNSAGGTGNVWLQRNLTTAVNTAYTLSVFAKADQLSWLRLQVNNVTAAGGAQGAYFNLSNGTVGTVQAGIDLGANIEDFGNGWYRCSVSFTSNASVTSGIFYILPADADNDINVDIDGTSSILIYGAQFEQGSTPTSYIPTSGSTVTRSADSTTISAGNMPAYTNALSFQMEGLVTGESSTFADWTLDANNGIQITSGASDFTFTQEAAGVVDSVTGGSYTSGVNTPFNFASTHASTLVAAAVDGTSLTPDTTPTALPDLSATTFDLAPTFNGFVKLFRVWSANITAAGREEAST